MKLTIYTVILLLIVFFQTKESIIANRNENLIKDGDFQKTRMNAPWRMLTGGTPQWHSKMLEMGQGTYFNPVWKDKGQVMLIYPDYDISQTIHLTRGKYILKYEWAGSKDPSHQVSAEVLWNGQKKTLIAKDQHIHHEEYEVFGEQGNNTLMFKGVGEYTVQLLHKAYTINNVQLVPIPLDYIKFKTTQGKDVSNKPHSQADGIIPIYPPRLEKTSATTILTSTNVPQLISTPANVIPSTTTASPITNHQDSHTLTVEDKINNVTPVQSKSSVKDSTQSINAPVTGISASVHTETPNPQPKAAQKQTQIQDNTKPPIEVPTPTPKSQSKVENDSTKNSQPPTIPSKEQTTLKQETEISKTPNIPNTTQSSTPIAVSQATPTENSSFRKDMLATTETVTQPQNKPQSPPEKDKESVPVVASASQTTQTSISTPTSSKQPENSIDSSATSTISTKSETVPHDSV